MPSNIKYLSIGFGISIFASILLLSGMVFAKTLSEPINIQATSTLVLYSDLNLIIATNTADTISVIASPVANITTTATTPAVTLTSTSTIDPLEALINDGTIQIIGPLTKAEQLSLYTASLKYNAPTRSEARKITYQINQSKNGYPDNTCGPLAIAILRDAGLLNQAVVPHDYWLLNPSIKGDRRKLETDAFPAGRYKHMRYKISIKRYDWNQTPLYPGDFVYLYAGNGGNFDHMLTVTRVDSANRVYSVTNYNNGDGFIITEALLYDPADPTAGLFAQWTQKQFAVLGSTGFDGFEIWRVNK